MATILDLESRFTQLTGTDEADNFIFIVDNNTDALFGFQDGLDTIDLSPVLGLSFEDLEIANGSNGRVVISYETGNVDDLGNPVIERIKLKDNAPGFSAADLTADDFIFAPSVPPAQGSPSVVSDNIGRFTQLRGSDAADAFVMLEDGHNDGIIGFQDGIDVIDMRAYAGLSFADLNIRTLTGERVAITYENSEGVTERITLKDNDIGFTAGNLTADDFIFDIG